MPTILLPEQQQRFLDWMLDPRPAGTGLTAQTKGSQNNLAKILGVDPSALSHWKKDPRFKQAWAEQVLERAGGPEALQRVLETLLSITQDKQAPAAARVAAAKEYLNVTERNTPKPVVKVQDPSLLNRDDAELLDAAHAMMARVAEARRSLGFGADGKRYPQRSVPTEEERLLDRILSDGQG
jgi:uncharacterized protein (UPF0147 family)